MKKEIEREHLLNWFKDKNGDRLWSQAVKEIKSKYKNMKWYYKLFYVKEIEEEMISRFGELLNKEFMDSYRS